MWRLMRLPLKTRLRPWLASNGVAFAPRCLRSGLQGQAPSEKLSGHRHVTLHTDAAKVYRCKIPGVLRDEVAHCKKKAKINGKWKWHAPNYVRLVAHKMHGQKAPVHCKAGTQVIDRAWRFLKDPLQINQASRVGIAALRAKLRSAQYEYWYSNHDMWVATGTLCSWEMTKFIEAV